MNTFEEIYQEHYKTMYGVAIKLVYDKDVVVDIVQDTFICLYEKLQSGAEIEYVKSWLYKTTLNKSIDYCKKKKCFEAIGEYINYEDHQESFEQKESKAIMRLCINKFKMADRKVLILYSEGLSYRDIAEVTGIKETSVGKTLSRLLKKLEQEYKKRHHEVL